MRCVLFIIGLLLLVGIAAGYTENFGNWDGTGWDNFGGGTASVTSYTNPDLFGLLTPNGPAGIYEAYNGGATNYGAVTLITVGSTPRIKLYDSLGNVLVTFTGLTPGRYKYLRVNSYAHLYLNGVEVSNQSCGTQPYYFAIGCDSVSPPTDTTWDDYVVGGADEYVVGLPPHTWFVGKDILTPSIKGLFDSSYNNVYTDHFDYTVSNDISTTIMSYSLPDPPTSGIITVSNGTASDYIQCRAVTLSGTNITWGSSTYAANDLATMNYTISSQYWDTTNCDYKIKVYKFNLTDNTTTLAQTHTINAANGTDSYQTTTEGIYQASLILDYKSAPNTDYQLDSDFMEVLQGIKIIGNVIDASTGLKVDSATVYCAQASTNESTSSSSSTGYTCPFTMSTGLQSKFTCTKTNYTQDVFAYTFTKAGTYQVDMNLLPYNGTSAPVVNGTAIWNGTAIYGLTISTPYNYAVPGATVTLSDGNTTTSSDTGYYHFDNVLPNKSYTLTGTKAGYADATTSVVTGSSNTGTRADLVFAEGFTVTVYVLDQNGAVIANTTTVCVNGASCQNTAGGVTTYSLPYGTYSISATCSGYTSNSQSVDVAGDTTVTIYLTKENSAFNVNNQGYGQAYAPHNVRFSVQTMWGSPIEGCNVTATGYETTAGSFDWFYSIIGWTNTTTPIANSTLQGTTDHLGQINFMMFEPVQYNMVFSKPGMINVTWTFYPKDEYYTVIATPLGNASWYQGGYNIQEVINSSVTGDETTGKITVAYNDSIGSTTGGIVWLNQTNRTNATLPETSLSNYTISSANFTHIFNTTNYEGQSYIVRIRANSSVFNGTVARDYGIIFRNKQLNPMGLTDFELMCISCVLIILMACFFGAVQAPQGGLIVCFVGWILCYLGWMNAMGLIAPTCLTLATVVAFSWLVMTRSRKGTWF